VIHLQKYALSWNDSSVSSVSLKYLRRSKIFGGSCFRIVLLRERVFHLPLQCRADYITTIWRRATESHPFLPSPSAYGRELLVEEGISAPIQCVNPPAPEAVINLVKCGCKKGCTGWCSCKNNIPCTEVCDNVIVWVTAATTDITP